jgi:DNA modification methylase
VDNPLVLEGDNFDGMQKLLRDIGPEFALIYMDPPFYTQREHTMTSGEHAFSDVWPSRRAFLNNLSSRLKLARELLDDRGSLVLHLNWRTSHYAKLLGDEIFGEDAFVSEIVWRYRRWPTATPNFQRMHDVLLRWVKNPKAEPRWTQLYEPLAPSTQKVWKGKRQKAVTNEWGKRKRSSVSEEPSPGAPMGDVWDISVVAPSSRERTGYPTQKPTELTTRLILALTEENDRVLDPYAGSGTTLMSANALHRQAYGIDSSPVACRVMAERMTIDRVII